MNLYLFVSFFTTVYTCGVSKVKPDFDDVNRPKRAIVEGKQAKPHSWSWAVVVLYNGGPCGGSLVESNSANESDLVLTAAHCFSGYDASNNANSVTVFFGIHTLDEILARKGEVKVKNVTLHEKYNDSSNANDIALLQLEAPIKFNENISQICLPDIDEIPKDPNNCWAVGWGETEVDHPLLMSRKENLCHVVFTDWIYDGSLRQAHMPMLNLSLCNHVHTEPTICAGDIPNGKATCSGDSGGPWMCHNQNNTWTLYGITSYGPDECGNRKEGAVFTDVAKYMDWIKEKLEQ